VFTTSIANLPHITIGANGGGGYTTDQTMRAMADGQAVHDGLTVKRNGWTIEPIRDTEN
jgi:hypothetical protein